MAMLIVFIVAVAAPLPTPAVAAPSGPVPSYVQATVVAPDAARGTLTFVDASGRSRSHRVAGPAAARLVRLRPGDQVIVVLVGSEGVVQDVRFSRPAQEPPTEPEAAAAPENGPQWAVVPTHQMRPNWPNPYSRFYRGPRPAPPRRSDR